MLRNFVAVALVALGLAADSHAGKVKVWQQQQPASFDKAKLQNAVVNSEGALRLGRQLKPLADFEAANVWALAEDAQGNLYAGTGDEGKVYKIDADGKSSVVYTASDSQVLSLATGADGAIYAGTGPKGRIVRIPAKGQPEVLAENLGYVWSLAFEPASKTLYAGTGPKGLIVRVGPDGKHSVFYTTKQDHVLSVAMHGAKELYAGTDKGGLVYRIDTRDAKAFVLFHAHQAEVRSLLVTPDAVYAGTAAPVARKAKDFPISKSEETKAASPAAGENSLYRLGADGSVRELMRDKVMFLQIARGEGALTLGTGMQGQLLELDERTRSRTEVARVDSSMVHALLRRRGGELVLGAGDPGKLYTLAAGFAARGTILSEVLDAKLASRWGNAAWQANTPAGTSIKLATRSGNVAEPDSTWSDWNEGQAEGSSAKVTAPAARYLQYRLTLATSNPAVTPEVRNLVLRYQTQNQPPEVASLDVPDLETASLDATRKLKIRWNASDPNEDDLTYTLQVRSNAWDDWVTLEEHFEKREYEWDTTSFPSGTYRVRVIASDRRDNPESEALTSERTSTPVSIGNLPPTVELQVVSTTGQKAHPNRQTIFKAHASDRYLRLTDAAYAVDGKRWVNIFPIDGIFDDKTESFRFEIDDLRPGPHVVVLRVRDAAGNVGIAEVVFRTQ